MTPANEALAVPPLGAMVIMKKDDKGRVTISCDTPGSKLFFKIGSGPVQTYTGPIPFKHGGIITSWAEYTSGSLVKMSGHVTQKFPRTIDRSDWKILEVDSFQKGEGDPEHVLDGNPATYWHTKFDPDVKKHPHEIAIDFGEEIPVRALTYWPRQRSHNGRIAKYEIYVSKDGENWGKPVAKGTFRNNGNQQTVKFTPVTCRYIKLKALSEVHNESWTTVAEIGILTTD